MDSDLASIVSKAKAIVRFNSEHKKFDEEEMDFIRSLFIKYRINTDERARLDQIYREITWTK